MIAAPAAAATPCNPHHGSGNSEIAQYLETVPGPCGDQPIGGNGSSDQGTSSGSGSNAAGLPTGTISALESFGPAGAQAAGFAEATSPPASVGGGASAAERGSSASGSGTTSDGGGSLLSALGNLLTGNDASAGNSGQGLGTWLPILFGMVLIGGLGVLALRRGRTG
jgi:hypothetical protein